MPHGQSESVASLLSAAFCSDGPPCVECFNDGEPSGVWISFTRLMALIGEDPQIMYWIDYY